MDMREPGPKRGSELDMAKGAQAREYARAEQIDARTDEQKLKDAVAVIEHNLSVQFAEGFGQVARQGQGQNERIAELEKRCFTLEGKVSDHGFRIADHDHQFQGSGITGTAKRWPVVTSQILAGAFNVLVVLPAAVWDYLPPPWPFVVASVLQAVAAVIGGRLTESKADLARLQDGQRVAPLPKPVGRVEAIHEDANGLSADVRMQEDMKERFTGTTGWRVGHP